MEKKTKPKKKTKCVVWEEKLFFSQILVFYLGNCICVSPYEYCRNEFGNSVIIRTSAFLFFSLNI